MYRPLDTPFVSRGLQADHGSATQPGCSSCRPDYGTATIWPGVMVFSAFKITSMKGNRSLT